MSEPDSKRRNHRWTESDFELLRQLRAQRVPVEEIARQIGTTTMSCFQYASRYGITMSRDECLACGKKLSPKKLGRRPEYCSPHCRELVRRAWQTNEQIDNRHHTHCLNCGARLIPPWSSKKKWCSRVCGQRGWYESSYYGGKRRLHVEWALRAKRRRIAVDAMTARERDALLAVRSTGAVSPYWGRKLREMLELKDTADLVRYSRAIRA